MIQTLSPKEMMRLFPWLLQDAGRNYFILLGLLDREPRFQQVFLQVGSSGEPVAALFQRISGNIQFYGGGVIDVQGFRQIIREIHASELIGFQSICNVLNVPDLFSEAREGAFLAEWNSCARLEPAPRRWRRTAACISGFRRSVPFSSSSWTNRDGASRPCAPLRM